jgi:hypothetical protein
MFLPLYLFLFTILCFFSFTHLLQNIFATSFLLLHPSSFNNISYTSLLYLAGKCKLLFHEYFECHFTRIFYAI